MDLNTDNVKTISAMDNMKKGTIMKKLVEISLSLLAFGLVGCHKSTEEKCRDGDMEACSEVFHKAVNDA